MTQGPNVKKLVARKMVMLVFPSGGCIADGLKALASKEAIMGFAKEATAWVETAIRAVREAQAPNPWVNCTDEQIAEHLISEIERIERGK